MHSSTHSSIYSLLHSLHWTSEISVQRSLSEIHSSILSSNTPEDQLIETLFPNVYSPILPEDPSNSASHFDHLFIDPSWTIYPEDHSSIYPEDHSSIQPEDHSSIHPGDALIDPDDAFILIRNRPTRLPIQSTDEPSAVQSQITFDESTDTKLSWIILYFITKKNVTISDSTCQTCNAFILWIGSYVIFSAPWCCPCI